MSYTEVANRKHILREHDVSLGLGYSEHSMRF